MDSIIMVIAITQNRITPKRPTKSITIGNNIVVVFDAPKQAEIT